MLGTFLSALIWMGAMSSMPLAHAADAEQALRAELSKGLDHGLPSISAAIATRQGVIWTGAVGYAELEKKSRAHEAHLYGIGSITKTFVACVIHQLADEGRLSLDATPLEILGEAAVGDIPNANRASIRHLLSHTSGIPTWEFDPEWIRRGRGSQMDIDHVWGKAETLRYIRGTRHKATNEPGASYAYSNSNHTILGLIIEKVTGEDASQVIRQRVLSPLGLTQIKLEGFEPIDPLRLPARYHFASADFLRDAGMHSSFRKVSERLIDVSRSNLSTEWTAGGMVASAHDLAEYALALRDGAILGPAAMKRMLAFRNTGEGSAEVSEGLFRQRYGNEVVIGHNGDVLGFGASLGWLEGEDLIIVLLTNAGTMHVGEDGYSPSRLLRETDFIRRAKELALTSASQPLTPSPRPM